MKTLKRNDWKIGAAVGTALSLGSGAAVAGPHGFDLHNVLHGASAAMAGTSIAHVEDPVSAFFGNPATLTTYFCGTNFCMKLKSNRSILAEIKQQILTF